MNMGFTDSGAFDPGARTLHPLGWRELCARLVAAQDLRRDQARATARFASASGTAGGSFHRQAALMLEAHGPGRDSAEHFVNPTSSGSGKDNRGTKIDACEPPLIARAMRQADEKCHD